MNERIKELIEECTSHIENMDGDWDEYFAKETFAELIIKECIYLVEKNKPDEIQRKEFPTDFIEGWENNSEVVIEDLMLHFGVNE